MFTDLTSLLQGFGALIGLPALIVVLISIGKLTGLVKDGQAPAYSLGLNLAGLVGLFVASLAIPGFQPGIIDEKAGAVAAFLTAILSLVAQLGLTKVLYLGAKGVPVIGASYSLAKKK